MRVRDSFQQCHLPASARGPGLSIKFSERLSSVTAFRLHDQPQRCVLDALHNDRVQHEFGVLSLLVWREIGQQVWRCSSRHVICNVSEARVASSRNRHSSCLLSSVPSKHDGRLKCRGFKIIMILQIRARVVSLLRYHVRMRHQHDENFVRMRENFTREHTPGDPSSATCHG